MKYETLENMEQVKNLQVGDVFPVLDQGDYIDGRFDAMLLERDEEGTMILLGDKGICGRNWTQWMVPFEEVIAYAGRFAIDNYQEGIIIERFDSETFEGRKLIKKYGEARLVK